MVARKKYDALSRANEDLTGYWGTIDSDHAYIHKGIAYKAIINTGSISAAYDIGFTTPTVASGKYIHWRPIGITSSADYVDIQLTEDETISGGTTVTPVNMNRLTTHTSDMQAFAKGVTCTPAGTLIDSTGIGSSGNPTAKAGGGAGAEQEIVLKQNTKYCITLTPDSATTCILQLFWYEETDGIVTPGSH